MQEKLLWQSTLRSLVTDEPGTPQTVNLASPLLSGSFVLKQQIKNQLLGEQLEFLQTDFNGVHHNVIRLSLSLPNQQLRTIYLKAYPEMPGMSYLIEQLHQHIIGHGTCFSELIKLERPGKEAIPI